MKNRLNSKKIQNSLVLRLLKVVFSIYLIITIFITLTQLVYEYQREKVAIIKNLQATQAIFEENLTAAAWKFDSTQLEASLVGIQKVPIIVGVQILQMEKSPTWSKAFPIRFGSILNKNNDIIQADPSIKTAMNKPYIYLIPHQFQLKKNNIVLAEVVFYSSNQIILDKIKYLILNITIAAIIKTLILWLLFIWAFNKYLGKHLNRFCLAMENVDIEHVEASSLELQTENVIELDRIESVFNQMLQGIWENKNRLESLNRNLEQSVLLRTQDIFNKNQQLEQLDHEKSEFLAIAAHDLKNPAAAIISFSQLIRDLPKNKDNLDRLNSYNLFIEKNAKRMTDLIGHLLDIDKIESGNVSVQLKDAKLLDIVTNVIAFNQPQADFKKIKIELKILEKLPVVLTDEFIATQILDNLISNAVKYSPLNSSIEIRLFKKFDKVQFEIQNQGQGLSAKDKQKLFLRFSHLSAKTTAEEHSSGLGLYIAQQLAAMLQTQICCESTENQGATFSVEF
ncbi:MAG: hypothetical protein GQ582_00110 [Methyloprofundus sp.]|nr:hypothetical protein [Methyloprofundus sp.]